MQLNSESVTTYLAEHGVIPRGADPNVEPLGGGVSNDVFRVSWDDDAVVVKQPYPNLEVEDDWPADVERVHNEAAAARVYRAVGDAHDFDEISVPKVRFEDFNEHVIAIEAAPSSVEMWKTNLLDGVVDVNIGETVGEFLAASHDFAANEPDIRDTFANYTPFEQLRLEPYHVTVAERHPDVRLAIETEIERIRKTRSTLVHGDYSPKNILVDGTGTQSRLWLLDFEVAHWGDPAFDVAFMLNHLFIKSVYNNRQRDEYVSTAEAIWEGYNTAFDDFDNEFETNVISELGVLMLARVDGKSPVKYVQQESTKEKLQSLAKEILQADMMTLQNFISVYRSEVDTL